MSSERISGVIPGIIGYTVVELERIWTDMCAGNNVYSVTEKRLACMAVGLVNQLAR